MKLNITPIMIWALVIFTACQGSQKNDGATVNDGDDTVMQEGFQLVNTACFACHSPDAALDNRVAPPMSAVKEHYMRKGMTRSEFVNDMTGFLKNPSMESTKMPKAVQRFGLMPNMMLSTSQYEAIATYLFKTELESPAWYTEHYAEEKKKYQGTPSSGDIPYLEMGLQYALMTKTVLGKNLLNALNTHGPEYAVEFCSERAIMLTDSMQNALNVGIKRVSDNNRNPGNAPDLDEKAYILHAKKAIDSGEDVKPVIREAPDKMIGYYPIMTNDMCLKCHGNPDVDIDIGTYARINALYPDDKATGYGRNELRGIWVVEMNK